MSDLLYSTSHLYLSESPVVESYIEEELIRPNLDFLTKFMVTTTLAILLTILVKIYKHGYDNFWVDHGITVVEEPEVSSIFDYLRGRKGLENANIKVYKKLGDKKFGGTIESRRPVFFVKDIHLAKQILKDFDHFANHQKFILEKSHPLIMRMLSNLTDQEWRDMRAILTQTFTTDRTPELFSYFNSCGVQFVEYIKAEIAKADTTDGISVRECFARSTIDVITTACYGVESSCLKKKGSYFYNYRKMCQSLGTLRMAKLFIAFHIPRFAALFGISFIEQESTNFFKNIVENTINHGKNNEKEQNKGCLTQDFLQLLVDTRDKKMKIDEAKLGSFEIEARPDDSSITSQTVTVHGRNCAGKKGNRMYLMDELIQSIRFLLLAGCETTASLLTFAMYALAVHPEYQEKVYQEVKECLHGKERNLDYNSVRSLPFMDMFINETLRMFPPAPRLERRCNKGYQVPDINLKLPKETRVVIPVIAFHHDEKYFPDPERFIPERFSPENRGKIHPCSFIPFGYGPQNCIGTRFAIAEAKAAIAHLVHNFIIEPTSSTPIPMQYDNSSPLLKPVRMMKIRFRPRK